MNLSRLRVLIVAVLSALLSSCASLGGQARVAGEVIVATYPQKIQFPPYTIRWCRKRFLLPPKCTEEFMVLPPGWMAREEWHDSSMSKGVILLPDGHEVHWDGGLFSTFRETNIPGERSEELALAVEHPRMRYVVLADEGQGEKLIVSVPHAVRLSVRVRSQSDIAAVLGFARTLTSTKSPCVECLRPVRPHKRLQPTAPR